jgi:serine protease Do
MHHSRIGALILGATLVLLASAMGPTTTSAQELRDLLPFGRTHRIARLLPTVVNISTHKLVHDAPGSSDTNDPHLVETAGSGFIIDSSGLIVTNRHVIEGAIDVTVTLQDGTALPAKILGAAGTIDVALLEVAPSKPLPKITWGDSDHVRIGDQVLAIGNPLGIGESVTSGIVSATNRDIMASPFDDYIQTDAAINHGNSGGPLFNMKGDVIGVNTSLYTPNENSGSVGLGFAIPGNDVQRVIDQLRRFGHVHRGWMGVRMQDVTPNIADALGLRAPGGAIIVAVQDDGPSSGKLRPGDVVLRFGKQAPKDARALARIVALTPTGETDPVLIWRDGQEETVSLKVEEWPDSLHEDNGKTGKSESATANGAPDLGLKVAPITDEARAKYKIASAQPGVVIKSTAPGSAAAERGLKAGDVILRVQQVPVGSQAEFQQALDDARAQKRHHILLLTQGPSGFRWVPVELSYPD